MRIVSDYACIHSQLLALFHDINQQVGVSPHSALSHSTCPTLCASIASLLSFFIISTGGRFAPLYPIIFIVSYSVCIHGQFVAIFYDLNQQVDVLPTLPCHTYRVCFFFVCFHSQHVALSHDITQQVDISGCGQRSCVC